MNKVLLKIKRQNDPDSSAYWEEFKIVGRPRQNVLSALQEVKINPVNAKGQASPAVVWESNCLEEICGSCTMIINGEVRQACSVMIDELDQPITLEPLSKFPVVRDLVVDRQSLFRNIKKTKPWIEVDGLDVRGEGLTLNEGTRKKLFELTSCIQCGTCMEVCPQYHQGSDYRGVMPVLYSQVAIEHPAGARTKSSRLNALMEKGGVDDCGNAQNCVKSCPLGIPLTTSLSKMKREVTKQAFVNFFGK